jgi:hypothetical protein
VRWPGENCGAFGFGLSFLLLFLLRKKVSKEYVKGLSLYLKVKNDN